MPNDKRGEGKTIPQRAEWSSVIWIRVKRSWGDLFSIKTPECGGRKLFVREIRGGSNVTKCWLRPFRDTSSIPTYLPTYLPRLSYQKRSTVGFFQCISAERYPFGPPPLKLHNSIFEQELLLKSVELKEKENFYFTALGKYLRIS